MKKLKTKQQTRKEIKTSLIWYINQYHKMDKYRDTRDLELMREGGQLMREYQDKIKELKAQAMRLSISNGRLFLCQLAQFAHFAVCLSGPVAKDNHKMALELIDKGMFGKG